MVLAALLIFHFLSLSHTWLSFLFVSSASPSFLVPLHHFNIPLPPPNLPTACPENSGLLSGRADWAAATGGLCVDKSKSRLTNDLCRAGWRHWRRGTGENRNVYTLTQADDVPWYMPSAGIISLTKYLWELRRAASSANQSGNERAR